MKNKVAVVTGGASGIGAATCRVFAERGAKVAILDLDLDRAKSLAKELGGEAFKCDVSSSAFVNEAFDAVHRVFGQIDILVNNAGSIGTKEYAVVGERLQRQLEEMKDGGKPETFLEHISSLTDEQWDRIVVSHLNGTFYCTRAVLKYMAPRRSGAIVNMGSIAGLIGNVGNAHYSAAKAGVMSFTRSAAKELILQNIRVNAVAPGYIETPLRQNVPQTLQRIQMAATPIGRTADPVEVANVIAFLASDDASYIVGEVVNISGGAITF